jgi:hypothetical protein
MNTLSRLQDTNRHEAGTLSVRHGIVCGRLEQFADALEMEPRQVSAAIQAAGIEPLVDTAQSKKNEAHTRPTDPALRCLAMTRADFRALCDKAVYVQNMSVSQETNEAPSP